eukprot:scaffold60022_cov35-Tisochrysis_lutea.AAC.4
MLLRSENCRRWNNPVDERKDTERAGEWSESSEFITSSVESDRRGMPARSGDGSTRGAGDAD